MKFSTANGLPFEDPAWIAGVDDDDKSENSETDADDDTDSGSDTDSDVDSVDDEIISVLDPDDEDPELKDNTYKGPDFEPYPVVVPVDAEHFPDIFIPIQP